MDPSTDKTADDRKEPRPRTYLGGKLVYGNYFSMDCVVRDITDGGARVQVNGDQPVPDDIFLLDLRSGVAYEAHIVWRRYPMIGLTFQHRYGLAEASTPHLRILRRLWMDKRGIGSAALVGEAATSD